MYPASLSVYQLLLRSLNVSFNSLFCMPLRWINLVYWGRWLKWSSAFEVKIECPTQRKSKRYNLSASVFIQFKYHTLLSELIKRKTIQREIEFRASPDRPRIDFVEWNIKPGWDVFNCLVAFRDDANSLGDRLGSDWMITGHHDHL